MRINRRGRRLDGTRRACEIASGMVLDPPRRTTGSLDRADGTDESPKASGGRGVLHEEERVNAGRHPRDGAPAPYGWPPARPAPTGRGCALLVVGLPIAAVTLFMIYALVGMSQIGDHFPASPTIVNDTSATLQIVQVSNTGRSAEAAVLPHHRWEIVTWSALVGAGQYAATGCTDWQGELVALDPAGREVSRRPARVCLGDVWEIGAKPSPSATRGYLPGSR